MSELCSAAAGVAPIAALDLVATTLARLGQRCAGVPGIGVLYGPAGWGKTFATNTLALESRAYYVSMRSAWRTKAMLEKILFEMGIAHGRHTNAALLDMVCEQLARSGRPLIIDEFDYCTKSDTLVELTRDLYEGSHATLLLVGEELLPRKLERWERFHSRVLTWAPAPPVTLADAVTLAPLYAPGVSLAPDVLSHLVRLARGSVRRVCVNLVALREYAMTYGLAEVGAEDIKAVTLHTGRAPTRRELSEATGVAQLS
ncbi:AAA family ATPase [Pandoraea apista]|uniref:AAA family ATPase n=1 Tax=Pandoraea apista TaxID=93218 RepID=UPI000F679242|nr:ATP-binding protein [Pandoraea apista]RRW95363.1 ATP-binding protein [Pandoraea apista]RRX04408.1 ATP-binding protein [Pandoraea apista]